MRFRIQIAAGGRAGQEVVVEGKVVRIGRDPSSDVALDPVEDSQASTNHAQIMLMDNGEVLLSDLGSSNGTFVGGEKIAGPTQIGPGAKITLGEGGPELVVHLEPSAPAEEPPAEEPPKKSNAGCVIALVLVLGLGFCLIAAVAAGALGYMSVEDAPAPVEVDDHGE